MISVIKLSDAARTHKTEFRKVKYIEYLMSFSLLSYLYHHLRKVEEHPPLPQHRMQWGNISKNSCPLEGSWRDGSRNVFLIVNFFLLVLLQSKHRYFQPSFWSFWNISLRSFLLKITSAPLAHLCTSFPQFTSNDMA